jgi:probable addiction module antidote protein
VGLKDVSREQFAAGVQEKLGKQRVSIIPMKKNTKIKLARWDSAEHLTTDEDCQAYLRACFEEAGGDSAFIAKALGTIARARGMTQLARETGIGRESLYKSLSGESNPSFDTIMKVVKALGLKLSAEIA